MTITCNTQWETSVSIQHHYQENTLFRNSYDGLAIAGLKVIICLLHRP